VVLPLEIPAAKASKTDPGPRAGEEGNILSISGVTAEEIETSLLAIPAFLPATVFTGYLAGWFTNLHGFRQRSLVERLFWSVPLSLAVSTITSVLIGKMLSLAAVVAFFVASSLLWLAVLVREWLQLRRAGQKWKIGWRPLGNKAAILALVSIAIAVLMLVDWQSGQRLFMSVPFFDHSARVNWTESVIRTGVPPANAMYLYRNPSPMRYYYFWNVVCAAVAKMWHLPVRAVLIASCVWAAFSLSALTGLYLKHFLAVGSGLRKQFLTAVLLLAVTGLDICPLIWNVMHHIPITWADLELWSNNQIASWFDSFLWVPHHIASLVCCMLAFLLAWMAGRKESQNDITSMILIAFACASAFGLSVYVAFGFFLIMIAWGFWQIFSECSRRSTMLLAGGGAGAVILLLPYLWELAHESTGGSASGAKNAGSVFAFAIRDMIPPDNLLATHFFEHLAAGHPAIAQNLANLILLAPGYCIELGFYLVVLLIYLVPAWRGKTHFSPARRSLVFISATALLLISILKSQVIKNNDFGWRAPLLLQFPLLLMATEVMAANSSANQKAKLPAGPASPIRNIPSWLTAFAGITLFIGVASTACQALMLRFTLPLDEIDSSKTHSPEYLSLSHDAYISHIGYAELDSKIPHDAVVQYDPHFPGLFWPNVDLLGVDHQVAIAGDNQQCGADLGGDPSGCSTMAAALDTLFNDASAEQARVTCHQLGIQYLVARIYDPAWKDKQSWVWTLNPVLADDEFRALDCR
jgi:hypothetical protein